MNFIKITEQPSIYEDLEQKSVRELLEGINEEDRKVASAVHACIPQIEKLVNEIVERMHQGGRIFYLGAGTSGRRNDCRWRRCHSCCPASDGSCQRSFHQRGYPSWRK